ncbi:MAG: double zinc ribbon domain-containing protein [bacterium]|nr:double zinc ribbon domain-containing protein [bacterium]
MFNFQKILDFLIPRRCAGCGEADEAFCAICRKASFQKGAGCLLCGFRNNTGEFCSDCRRKRKSDFPLEVGLPNSLKSVLWAGRYDGELKKAIWELKYGKRREIAKPLAGMMAEKFFEVIGGSLPSQQFARHGYFSAKKFLVLAPSRSQGPEKYMPSTKFRDSGTKPSALPNFLAIPIPLHFKRQYERGFNQAELLAREFSKITGIAMRNDILKKIKETPAQVEVQNKELRLKNLENAFEVSLPPHRPSLLRRGAEGGVVLEKTIILIDDVSTTGATLMHAATALKNAGAKEIVGFVVAHG